MWEYTCLECNCNERPDSDSPFSTQLNIQMHYMFWGAAAFNQPIAFNTTEVTNVRGIYFYEALLLQLKQQILIFYFPPNSLDGRHVQRHSGLQSTTSFQYYWGYKCERHILLWSPTATIETTDSDFLFSTQFIRWATCSKAQRPSINLFLSILLRLQVWVHMLASSLTTAMRNLILIFFFLPYRCGPCSGMQLPLIRTCVILETISARSVCFTYFWTLDAVSKKPRPVQLGRGVPSTPILSSEPQSRSILAKDAQLTCPAKPVLTIEAQWVVYGDLP